MSLTEYTKKKIGPKRLDELWIAIGWTPRKTKWLEVLSKSSFVYSIWDGRRLAGLGRIVEDGVMCMFYDIGVHPDFQGKHSVGPRIIEALIAKVKSKGYASIGLFRWEPNLKNNTRIYEKFGFKNVNTGMELTKYMKRE
ncbi:GNAT family N-acetyltransferase [Candidatus Woesearchaeota archaeon]|nr:GNAT family N-acetyltransferase [Candidatus Woesearchaeota archaeon]